MKNLTMKEIIMKFEFVRKIDGTIDLCASYLNAGFVMTDKAREFLLRAEMMCHLQSRQAATAIIISIAALEDK